VGGLATNPAQQLAARALQGLGGALVFPRTLAIINVRFSEGAERNRHSAAVLVLIANAGTGGLAGEELRIVTAQGIARSALLSPVGSY
jgi:MFS family permease